jgi:hypothetical protein
MTHIHTKENCASDKCICGETICLSLAPNGKTLCMLTDGHLESCYNPYFPERGTWEKQPNPAPNQKQKK